MTLDHLRIIHQSMIRIIRRLSLGELMPGQASTAAVKPNPEVTIAVVDPYEKSCDDLLATVADIRDLNTQSRYTHPWFGSLNASGWHAMSASHIGIHRVQIERILAGLPAVQERIPA
jgi:hypothetical protein